MRQSQRSQHLGGNRVLRWYAAVLAIFALTVGVLVSAQTPAQAANITDGFDHTEIISDAEFYNGRAMTEAQVQAFLNARVPRCTIGDAGRKAGSRTERGNIIAAKCLKDFAMTTASQAANQYCGAYTGQKNESAARIITKVAQACGISQKALLIMLEKEQSLVTDSWPVTRMYAHAMGFACPDSGPNNSANCDEDAAGFFTQVYRAARQLKVYLYHPSLFNYRAGQSNRVQWHPNAGCGTSTFTIKNNATAALYIYTPYRPNAAALRAGWGTGDSCSSYGNRNFYNFWKSWFGTIKSPTITGDIEKYYDANNGPTRFGLPLKTREYVSQNGGGYVQHFERGMIATSLASGRTFGITDGPFLTKYEAKGGPAGSYGWLAGNAVCGKVDGGCSLPLQNGELWYSRSTGANFLPSALVAAWRTHGSETGAVGYPITDGQEPARGTAYVEGQRSMLMVSPAGVVRLSDAQTKAWKAAGGFARLGVVIGGADRVTSSSQIVPVQRGQLFIQGNRSPLFIGNGAFLTRYMQQKGPRGPWGWPTAAATCGLANSGCTLEFEKGAAVYSPSTNVAFLDSQTYRYWKAQGADRGNLGYPKGDSAVSGQKRWQNFERAGVATLGANQIRIGSGPFLDTYAKTGGPTGPWGWPRSAAKCGLMGGGCTLEFDNGAAVYSTATGVRFVSPEMFAHWNQQGADRSNLGYPTAETQRTDSGSLQRFERAVVTERSGKYVRIGAGPFASEFLKQGGLKGGWGTPTAGATCGMADGGCVLPFENGVAIYSKTTGVRFITPEAYDHWKSQRAETGNLGYPAEDTVVRDDGWLQRFTRAIVTSHRGKVIRVGNGPFVDQYLRLTDPQAEWGWPTAPAVCGLPDSGCRLEFSNGVAQYTKSKGVVFIKR